MIGVAVKVTLVPALMVLSASLETILTLAGKLGFTVIVTVFEVAGELVKHGVAFEVITTETVFPFANVVDV